MPRRDTRATGPSDLDPDEIHISPSRLADYWGVHINTIYRDIRKGALPAFQVGSARRFRIRMSDAKRYGKPVE